MQVRLISLGEIITPDIMKCIQAFTVLIAKKKASSDLAEIGKSIGAVMQANMSLINQFKLGKVSEEDFNEQMIALLEKATNVKLTVDEFDGAWNTMNPVFKQYELALQQAIQYNKQPDQQIIFISFTNPKDIRFLMKQLDENNINYKVENGQLSEIAGIKLLTTYHEKKSKEDLIEDVIKRLLSKRASQSALASSMNNVFNAVGAETADVPNIFYIRGVNRLNDPILKEDLDRTNQKVEEKASLFYVDVVLWKKFENQTLADVLNIQQHSLRQATTINL